MSPHKSNLKKLKNDHGGDGSAYTTAFKKVIYIY